MQCDSGTKERIAEYLKSHPYLNLATVSPEGKPMVHSMGFVSAGPVVYFGTGKDTRNTRISKIILQLHLL